MKDTDLKIINKMFEEFLKCEMSKLEILGTLETLKFMFLKNIENKDKWEEFLECEISELENLGALETLKFIFLKNKDK